MPPPAGDPLFLEDLDERYFSALVTLAPDQ